MNSNPHGHAYPCICPGCPEPARPTRHVQRCDWCMGHCSIARGVHVHPPTPERPHYRYRFDMQGAHEAGEHGHPQAVISTAYPDAYAFEPVSIADCWLFTTPRGPDVYPLPAYVIPVGVVTGAL
jgi:hypothetical protein